MALLMVIDRAMNRIVSLLMKVGAIVVIPSGGVMWTWW